MKQYTDFMAVAMGVFISVETGVFVLVFIAYFSIPEMNHSATNI